LSKQRANPLAGQAEKSRTHHSGHRFQDARKGDLDCLAEVMGIAKPNLRAVT
jgi:hypothetical protein